MLALHITLAFVSVAGFLLRLGWSVTAPDMLSQKFVRIAPHVVDSLLLVAGIMLALNLPDGFLPGWLIAKWIALIAYVGFGVMALRGAGPRKWIGAVGALLAVAYIFAVAYGRSAMPV